MIKLFSILLFGVMPHPVHVSMSSIWMDAGTDEIMLSVRMYTDDLALDLFRLYDAEGEYVDLDHRFIFKGDDSYYTRYVEDNLKVYINGKRAVAELAGKEILEMETVLTFRILSGERRIKRVDIENKILSELYNDQVNLFIVGIGDEERGLRFTRDNTRESVEFNR